MSEPPLPAPTEPRAAPPRGLPLSPALQAALLDPASWHESLAAYAAGTNLAVLMVDVVGRPVGPCLNPRPTWQRWQAHPPAAAPPHAPAVPSPWRRPLPVAVCRPR